MLVCVSSSAFFSNETTHTFLFCLHLVAAALFRSRNFRRRSSGSSSTTRLRRPPLCGGECIVCEGCICWVAGDICNRRGRYQHHWALWWDCLPPSHQTWKTATCFTAQQASIHYLLQPYQGLAISPPKKHLVVPRALGAGPWASGVTEWVRDWADSPACPPR